MTTDPRPALPTTGDEATLLLAFWNFLRGTVRLKTAGLDAEQLGRTHPPSTMTLGGMLKHLAYVETSWFSGVLRGDPDGAPFDDVDWAADRDWDWHSAADDGPEELRALFDRTLAASDAIVAAALADGGLDTLSVRTNRRGEHWNLRWILVHMIEEYGRHAGHADLLREAIDGQVGE